MDSKLIFVEVRDELCSWIDSSDLDIKRKILLKNIIQDLSDDELIYSVLDIILNEF